VTEPHKRRPIRSFVLRTGRMTPGQQRSYERNWSRWGLEYDRGLLDFEGVFGAPGTRVLEIGFGMGLSLAQMAEQSPDKYFVGVEVHRPGVGKLFHELEERGIENVRAYCHDAVEVLKDCIAPESLDVVQVFFPDPWHKKKHHKRRIVQPSFVSLIAQKLKLGGFFHVATDWEDYATHIDDIMALSPQFQKDTNSRMVRPETKFEKRGVRLGHKIQDLIFIKK